MWPRLSKSPILRDFSWSPLVLESFASNAHLFGATTKSFGFPSYLRPSSSSPTPQELHNVEPILPATKIDPIPGLLVLHIRRGDFADHCRHLANWSSDFNGFNKFATLPDRFRPPYDGGNGQATEASLQYYLQRCFPTVEQIVERVRQVLADQRKTYGYGRTKGLKRVYIMTNGDKAWLDDLKEALMEIKTWDSVSSSRDLRLGWEAKPVAQAMDMLVGQRAQVFIGNGVSHSQCLCVQFCLSRTPVFESNFQYRHVSDVARASARRYQIFVTGSGCFTDHPVVLVLASGIMLLLVQRCCAIPVGISCLPWRLSIRLRRDLWAYTP